MRFLTTFQRIMEFDNKGVVGFIETPFIPPAPHTLWDEIVRIFSIFVSGWGQTALMLNASSGRIYPDVLAIILLRVIPSGKRPLIALVGEMWQPNKGLRGRLERILLKAADKIIGRYVVHSTDELDVFPAYWGIDGRKVRYCPYFASVTSDEVQKPAELNKGYVFAGGNSHRNYEPLIEVARLMPEVQFIVASRRLDERSDLPPNIKKGEVTHRDFMDLMKSASVVVVPMMSGLSRAAGQQTYLNAMMLQVPVVVSDGLGVRDYLEDKKTGMIVSGSVDSYLQAIRWLLDRKNKQMVDDMRRAAHTLARSQFTKERHVARLIELMMEFIVEKHPHMPQ
jgi:glycosyltransferase involved in cell wall biosynthesis